MSRSTQALGYLIPLLLLVVALGACAGPAVEVRAPAEERNITSWGDTVLVHTQRREDGRQRFLLLKPNEPEAAVVLFPGGSGRIEINEYGNIRRGGNPLVRSRNDFKLDGMLVAVMDTPDDRNTLAGFRFTERHMLDIKGVIAYLREGYDVPVWLIGHSRGTVSAAMAAGALGDEGPDGIVLAASLTRRSHGESVYRADTDGVRVPVLVVHHRQDACHVTPYTGAADLVDAFPNAPATELITIEGGGPTRGPACEPFHYHGFVGQESQTMRAITDWIKAHPPQ